MSENQLFKEITNFEKLMTYNLTSATSIVSTELLEAAAWRLHAAMNECRNSPNDEEVLKQCGRTFYSLVRYGIMLMNEEKKSSQRRQRISIEIEKQRQRFGLRGKQNSVVKSRKFDDMPLRLWFLRITARPYPLQAENGTRGIREEIKHLYEPGMSTPDHDQIKDWFNRFRHRSGWNKFYQRYASSNKDFFTIVIWALQLEQEKKGMPLGWSAGPQHLYEEACNALYHDKLMLPPTLEQLFPSKNGKDLEEVRHDWQKVIKYVSRRIPSILFNNKE